MTRFIRKQRFMNHEIPFVLYCNAAKKDRTDGRRLSSVRRLNRRERNVTDPSPLIAVTYVAVNESLQGDSSLVATLFSPLLRFLPFCFLHVLYIFYSSEQLHVLQLSSLFLSHSVSFTSLSYLSRILFSTLLRASQVKTVKPPLCHVMFSSRQLNINLLHN